MQKHGKQKDKGTSRGSLTKRRRSSGDERLLEPVFAYACGECCVPGDHEGDKVCTQMYERCVCVRENEGL